MFIPTATQQQLSGAGTDWRVLQQTFAQLKAVLLELVVTARLPGAAGDAALLYQAQGLVREAQTIAEHWHQHERARWGDCSVDCGGSGFPPARE